MDFEKITAELMRLSALVENWKAGGAVVPIERDLALAELRTLYEMILFPEKSAAVVSASERDRSAAAGTETGSPESVAIRDEAPEPVAAIAGPDAADAAVEAVPDASDAAGSEPVGTAAVDAQESGTESAPEAVFAGAGPDRPVGSGAVEAVSTAALPTSGNSLFDLDKVAVRRAKHRVVMSLYGVEGPELVSAGPKPAEALREGRSDVSLPTGPASEAASGPTVSDAVPERVSDAEPVVSAAGARPASIPAGSSRNAAASGGLSASGNPEPAILGELLNSGVRTVSDVIAAPHSVVAGSAGVELITDLRKAICNNDRFLLARDLFGGDMAACEAAIDRLNEFRDLDECMIYIAEHYEWNPDCDGARLLTDLLERKLG